jgi:hypothetical protein
MVLIVRGQADPACGQRGKPEEESSPEAFWSTPNTPAWVVMGMEFRKFF